MPRLLTMQKLLNLNNCTVTFDNGVLYIRTAIHKEIVILDDAESKELAIFLNTTWAQFMQEEVKETDD